VTAVDGLDLQLGRAEVLALLGPNGAGKTTTVEMCEGFITPDAGTVSVLGIDPVADADQLRTRIGIMLQGGGAYPGVRVGEMLRLAASYSADPLDPDWLLETVGLAGHEKSNYRRLSGGQQQRLCIARTIAVSPEVILMDEPCSALDPIATAKVEELISELSTQYTIAIVTHSMQQAARVSDRTAYFHLGDLIEVNSTEKVFTQPDHQLTEAYITGRFG